MSGSGLGVGCTPSSAFAVVAGSGSNSRACQFCCGSAGDVAGRGSRLDFVSPHVVSGVFGMVAAVPSVFYRNRARRGGRFRTTTQVNAKLCGAGVQLWEEVGKRSAESPRKEKLRGYDFWKSIGSPRFICAPMVNGSELAFRMLTRHYGVELAYTPMINSNSFLQNRAYRRQRSSRFSTVPEDRPLIAQFAGDDADTIIAAARHLQAHVDAIDLNLGCPEGIARKGHYGAYLLEETELVTEIVRQMDAELEVPVACKIRKVSRDLQDTLRLAHALQEAGCSVLCVHGRTKEEKKDQLGECDWDTIRIIKEQLSIPVVANGGIETYQDVLRCLEHTGCDGVMSSEALLETPVLFSGQALPQDVIAEEYLQAASTYKAEPGQVRAHLFRLLYAGLRLHTDIRDQLVEARSLEDMAAAAAALRERRKKERVECIEPGASWPDSGWYRRHRDPLKVTT